MANCHFIILWGKNYISGKEIFFKVYDLGVSKGVLLGQSCISNWKESTDSSLNAPQKRWATFSVNYTSHSLIREKGFLSLSSVFKIWNNIDPTTQGSNSLPWCFVITKEMGRLEAAAHHLALFMRARGSVVSVFCQSLAELHSPWVSAKAHH